MKTAAATPGQPRQPTPNRSARDELAFRVARAQRARLAYERRRDERAAQLLAAGICSAGHTVTETTRGGRCPRCLYDTTGELYALRHP